MAHFPETVAAAAHQRFFSEEGVELATIPSIFDAISESYYVPWDNIEVCFPGVSFLVDENDNGVPFETTKRKET